MKKLKVSFDFDCTLSELLIQEKAKMMIQFCDVYIITARCEGKTHNKDLYRIADKLNISHENIFFTEGGWKWSLIDKMEIDIHYDDVPEECELISLNTKCMPLLIWDEYCKGSIKHESFGNGIY